MVAKVFCFEGDENFLIEEAVNKIRRSALSPSDELMNYELIEDSDIKKVINSVSVVPFFGGNRLVYVKNPDFLKQSKKKSFKKDVVLAALPDFGELVSEFFIEDGEKLIPVDDFDQKLNSLPDLLAKNVETFVSGDAMLLDKLIDILQSAPESTIVVFSLFGGKADKRKKSIKTLKKIANKWETFTKTKNFTPGQRDQNFEHWLQQQAQQRGYYFAPEALALLSTIGGRDMAVFVQEIEKFCIYAGSRKEITIDDVKQLLSYGEMAEYEISNAVRCRDKQKLLSLLHSVLKDDFGSLMQNMGGIAYQVRSLLKVKSLQQRGVRSQSEIASAAKVHPFVAKLLLADVAKYSLSELENILIALHQLDYDIKSGKGDSKLLLELMISKSF